MSKCLPPIARCLGSIILAGLATVASPATAQNPNSGNFWLSLCQESHPSCTGYLAAIGDFHSLSGLSLFCAPKTVTTGQMQAVVTKYLRDNPAELHEPFVVLIVRASQKAFPCPRKSN